MRMITLAFLVFIAGCAQTAGTDWQGKHVDELIRAWGPPDEETKLPDGGVRLIYIRGVVDRGMASVCRVYYEADTEGRIRQSGSHGCSP